MREAEKEIAKELVSSPWLHHVLDLLSTGLNQHLHSVAPRLSTAVYTALWILRWSGFRVFDLCHPANTVRVEDQHVVVILTHHKTSSRTGQAILRHLPLKVFPAGLLPQSGPVLIPTYAELRKAVLPVWPAWDHHTLRRARLLELAKSLTLESLAAWFAHASKSSTLTYLRALPSPVRDSWQDLWTPAPPLALPAPPDVLGRE